MSFSGNVNIPVSRKGCFKTVVSCFWNSKFLKRKRQHVTFYRQYSWISQMASLQDSSSIFQLFFLKCVAAASNAFIYPLYDVLSGRKSSIAWTFKERISDVDALCAYKRLNSVPHLWPHPQLLCFPPAQIGGVTVHNVVTICMEHMRLQNSFPFIKTRQCTEFDILPKLRARNLPMY